MATGRGGRRSGAGRPRGSTAVSVELRKAAQLHSRDALEVLIEIMNEKGHPHQLKAAKAVLERGHGVPREEPASFEIIRQFMEGKTSAIRSCLLLEAEGLRVPEIMREFYNNEIRILNFVPFDNAVDSFNMPPVELPRS